MDSLVKKPKIASSAYVNSSAVVIGDVTIEAECLISPQVSIRADEGTPFLICKGTNIQDGVNIHGLFNRFVEVNGVQYSVYIGSHCSIAHNALVHGPTKIDKKTFVGFRATVHESVVGRNCFIDKHALVDGVTLPDYTYVPKGAIIDSQEAVERLFKVKDKHGNFNKEVVDFNKDIILHYKKFYSR